VCVSLVLEGNQRPRREGVRRWQEK